MTTPSIAELIEKMRATMKLADEWAMTREGRDGSGLMVQCMDRLGEGSRALSTLNEEVERLREALLSAANAMTCGDDNAHYCPNCDNSMWAARTAAFDALQSTRGGMTSD